MATPEKLTVTALKIHNTEYNQRNQSDDKIVLPEQKLPTLKTPIARLRHLSRGDSKKSLNSLLHGSGNPLSRQNSKSSLNTLPPNLNYLLDRQNSKSSVGTSVAPAGNHNKLDRQISKSSLSTVARSGSVFRVVQAARAWKRLSEKKRATEEEKPKILLENTYRLGPDHQNLFRPDMVKNAVQEIQRLFLTNFKYKPEDGRRMCLNISAEAKARVKRMNFPRYKVVCWVTLMQKTGQGSHVASRCLWTSETDSFSSSTFENDQVVCVVNVFGVYFE